MFVSQSVADRESQDALRDVRSPSIRYSRDHLPRDPQAPAFVVSDDVVGGRSEEWRQCLGVAEDLAAL
jgi:hypothetical protein